MAVAGNAGVFLCVARAEAYAGKPIQISIDDIDEKGAGSGYRIAGPKYGLSGSVELRRHKITERDISEIRAYLKVAARQIKKEKRIKP